MVKRTKFSTVWESMWKPIIKSEESIVDFQFGSFALSVDKDFCADWATFW